MQKKPLLPCFSEVGVPRVCVSPPPELCRPNPKLCAYGRNTLSNLFSLLNFPGLLASFCRQRSEFSALLSGETGEKGVFFGLPLQF